jgi:hypothetical protein
MIWRNPLLWAALPLLGIPILIHLLGLPRPRVLKFPTLRFLGDRSLTRTRRTRLSELLLLAVRLLILLAVIAALAQPIFLSDGRRDQVERALARAIIVDTSASMQRPATSGLSGTQAARDEAGRLSQPGVSTIVLESAHPARLIEGASAWLQTRPGRRELILISDFQTGSLDKEDVAAVSPEVGLTFRRIGIAADSGPATRNIRVGGSMVEISIAPGVSSTGVRWTRREATDSHAGEPVLLTASPGLDDARAAGRAALALGVPARLSTEHNLAIVYPDYPARDSLLRVASSLTRPWMGEVAAFLARDSLLLASVGQAESRGEIRDDSGIVAPSAVLIRSPRGAAAISAAAIQIGGREHLAVVAAAPPASIMSAAVFSALIRANGIEPPYSEADPSLLPDSVLTSLSREAAPVRGVDAARTLPKSASDSRWLWLCALGLLGAESLLRRKAA